MEKFISSARWLSLYQENTNGPAAKYGLPNESHSAKVCVLNQRETSVEYQHTKDSKKPQLTLILMSL